MIDRYADFESKDCGVSKLSLESESIDFFLAPSLYLLDVPDSR